MSLLVGFLRDFMVVSTLAPGSAWLLCSQLRGLRARDALFKGAVIVSLVFPLTRVLTLPRPQQRVEQLVVKVRDATALDQLGVRMPPTHTRVSGDMTRLQTGPSRSLALAAGIALAAGLLNLLRVLLVWRRELEALGPRRPLDPPAWPRAPALHPQHRQSGLRITTAPGLLVPAVVGRSEICLPECADARWTGEAFAAVLAHELAHVQQRDLSWTRFTGAMAAFFFYQPLLRSAHRQISALAEFRADQRAVHDTGDPRALATALLTCARRVAPAQPDSVRALGSHSRFADRVERILDPGTTQPLQRDFRLALPLVLLSAALAAAPHASHRRANPVTRAVVSRSRTEAASPGPLIEVQETAGNRTRSAAVTRGPDGALRFEYRENGHPIAASADLETWLRRRLDLL